ncbi:MAG: polyphosphate kinase 2 family protein, partial [Bacteroidetes bacterium]
LALNRCSTPEAPWYVVPAEKRWFRNLVVARLLVDTLQAMNPQYPPPSFDPADYPPASLR